MHSKTAYVGLGTTGLASSWTTGPLAKPWPRWRLSHAGRPQKVNHKVNHL